VLLDQLFLGSWPADWDVTVTSASSPSASRRKALGGSMAFEAFAQAVDIWGLSCVWRNDAAAAFASFCKGSTALLDRRLSKLH
jgi:hypothetical protein